MFSVLGVAVGAAYHVVSAYVQVLAPVAGSLATVAAIVAFTMTVRLLLRTDRVTWHGDYYAAVDARSTPCLLYTSARQGRPRT